MKNKRPFLCTVLYMTMLLALCFAMRAGGINYTPQTTMYAPDGRTLLVQASQVEIYQNVGWYTEPVRMMYAADGRTLVIPETETELYINVGWYTEPVRTMYAADGRTLVIKTAETVAYENVGWFTEPPIIMYAADGRTLAVNPSDVAAHETVGWFTEPPVIMYAMDGRTLAIKANEVTAYENVGWFTEPPLRVYATDGRTLDIKGSELQAYLNVGWYRSPKDFPVSGAMVALTFDDGPSRYTNRILDCLAKYNAKATFFVVGNSVSSYPDVVKRAYNMGMEIGNHTMTHPNLKTLSADSVSRELNGAANKIASVIGVKPTLLRPPYGNYNSTVSSISGTPLILWSIDTLDWKTRNADKTVNCVMNEVKDGSIILMHDLYEASAAAAERIIPQLIKRGYKLVTVSQLAQAKGYNLVNGKAYHSFR